MLVLGIDDAGRGPLIGPMALAGIIVKAEDQPFFRDAGIKDSKLLTQKKRLELGSIIAERALDHKVVLVSPAEIDEAVISGKNLNTLDAIKMGEIINSINIREIRDQKVTVIVDCPSPNLQAWRATLLKYVEYTKNLDVRCEHKADFNHPAVSAASVLAKLAREEAVAAIKTEFGDIGSGYLTDPLTQKFLKENSVSLENAGIFRKSWVTWKNHLAEKEQKKLF